MVEARVGSTIEVQSVQVGQAVRRGVVKQTVATDPLQLRVEWEDGHESVIFPKGGMVRVVESGDG
ncbi:hypothetical protein BH23ACT7_BH23ACT7_20150 [soil metagenome]|jgi:hypothetical protein|nr:DUF1918 domain-containing protein [Euzebyaceae bacterium]